jgi:hypothetical protein
MPHECGFFLFSTDGDPHAAGRRRRRRGRTTRARGPQSWRTEYQVYRELSSRLSGNPSPGFRTLTTTCRRCRRCAAQVNRRSQSQLRRRAERWPAAREARLPSAGFDAHSLPVDGVSSPACQPELAHAYRSAEAGVPDRKWRRRGLHERDVRSDPGRLTSNRLSKGAGNSPESDQPLLGPMKRNPRRKTTRPSVLSRRGNNRASPEVKHTAVHRAGAMAESALAGVFARCLSATH